MAEMTGAGVQHDDAALIGRIEPPGWMTQVAPASTTTSRPSRKGKKASDATTEPASDRPAFCALIEAMRAESMRLIWPAPTPRVMLLPQKTMAFDLTYLATRQANIRSCNCCWVGCSLVTTLRSPISTFFASADCTSRPPPTRLKSIALTPWPSGISSRRTFCLADRICLASAENDGAISTSTNSLASSVAAAAPTSVLKAMMPPKADVGSVCSARLYASAASAPSATPQGLACLTMTQAALWSKPPRLLTHSHAASASAMLLYDSSLPCS